MFKAEIRNIMYTPVNPSITIEKLGLRGSKFYRYVFVMDSKTSTQTTCCGRGTTSGPVSRKIGDNLLEILNPILWKKERRKILSVWHLLNLPRAW